MEYIESNIELYFKHNAKICRNCKGIGIREFKHTTEKCGVCNGIGIFNIPQ